METELLSTACETEEGEIADDIVEDIYVPLERPPLQCVAANDSGHHSDADDAAEDSSSDSDAPTRRSSFSKSKKKPVAVQEPQTSAVAKKKRNNIWCTDIQTEVLTNNLVKCNVDQKIDRSRDVESYDFTLATGLYGDKRPSKYDNQDRRHGQNWKRKSDGGFVEAGLRNKTNETKKNTNMPKGAARSILKLSKGLDDSIDALATDIANKLCEEKEDLVLRALKVVGKEVVLQLFKETQAVEENGGMMIMNGTRRRTPGGVFFFLLKSSSTIPQEQISQVFADDRRSTAQDKKKTARELRRQRTAKLREAMSKDDFPTLLSRTELAIKQFKARSEQGQVPGLQVKEEVEVKNPPPSPATDGRENSSDGEEKGGPEERSLAAYDDDDLFTTEDAMELA